MEDTVIKEVIKKSELAAKDAYEYQWITYPEYGFLQSHIEAVSYTHLTLPTKA